MYQPQNWTNVYGETPYNADRMNYIEKGIANVEKDANEKISNISWSGPKLFNITSDKFENNLPTRNYYMRCGKLVLVNILVKATTDLQAVTRHNIETDLPKPIDYHATTGFIDTKMLYGTIYIDKNSQLRVFPSQKMTTGDVFIAQMFYITDEE